MDRDNLICEYFKLGLKYQEILHCLVTIHGFLFSLRTLKRITKRMGWYRKKCNSDILEVALFLVEQCAEHGSWNGYQWLHTKCLKNGLVVSQDCVRVLLHIIAPEGIILRKAKQLQRRVYRNPGPNSVWHIDGYDKLSRYGVSIHGCVDGYSPKIIWLQAGVTNRQPDVIATYYIEAIRYCEVYHQRVRADVGTENVHVEQIHKFLRRNDRDQYAGERSFMYGKSVNNQRIESMWGNVRRQGIQYWINIFQELAEEGMHDGSYLDQELTRFCFMTSVQVCMILLNVQF